MKLKNSYILLIAMAIFLLVSIGSVCAEDSTGETIDPAADGNDKPIKINTEIDCEDNIQKNEADIAFDLNVKDNESAVINITKDNLTIKEGNKDIKFEYSNSKITIIDRLTLGQHNLIIGYLGDNTYTDSTKNIVLTVVGDYTLMAPGSVDVNSTRIVEIPIGITNGTDSKVLNPEDFNVTLSYKDGNDTKTISIEDFKIENNKIIFNYTLARNIKTSTVTVTYTADETVKQKLITLKRIYNVKIEAINTTNQYQNGEFVFKLTDIDNENENLTGLKLSLTLITGTINPGYSGTADENGTVKFKTTTIKLMELINSAISSKNLNVGNYTAKLSTSENVKSTPLTTNLTIIPAEIIIKIEDYKELYGTDKNLTIIVTNAKNGEVVPDILLKLSVLGNGNYYIMTDSNGIGGINCKQLPGGEYNITVSNNDTENINYTNSSGKIIIDPIDVTITVSGLTNTYNTGSTATVKVVDKKTGKGVSGALVLIQVFTGKTSKYYATYTDKNGIAKFLVDANVGKHKIVVQSGTKSYSGNIVTKSFTVYKASAKITAPKLTAYYKQQGKYFTVKIVNTKKKNAPIAFAKLNVRIYISAYKYYNYVGTTDGNGQIRIDISTLAPKTYKVEVLGADSKNFAAKKVSSQLKILKAPTKLTPTKLVAKKGKTTYFKVTVKNTKTNKIISGVKIKIKVYTGKKFKTYTVTTNSKGIAQLNVKSLSVGTHKVVVSSGNSYCVAKSATSSIKINR